MKMLRLVLTTFRLAILRIGPGWMFGLLTINFNFVAAHRLGAVAFIIMTLVGLHHFLSPLQVMWGHLADRYPLFGYRRTPYIFLSGLVGALVFLMLPWLSIALGDPAQITAWMADHPAQNFSSTALMMASDHAVLTVVIALVLFIIFGIAMAANGNSAAALVAEVVDEQHRGTVFVIVWLFMIFTSIAAAGVTKAMMPEYDPQQMQMLYNLTLPLVIVTSLIGLVGMERRISPEEHATLMERTRVESSSSNAFRVFWKLLNTNRHVRQFFLFVLLAIFGIFLQDGILEVFGGDVFGMSQGETASFTQYWGGGMLLGIMLVVIVSQLKAVSRKTMATVGGFGIALALMIVAFASFDTERTYVMPGLILMGICTGLFNIGALAMMIDMTVEGHAGLYMGMWGLAQGFGTGLANSISGALRTILIEHELLIPSVGYGFIFTAEALVMVLAILLLRGISVQDFKVISGVEVSSALAFETAT